MIKTYKIYPNVKLGKNVTIGDFVIIGIPPKGVKEGKCQTIIGNNAIVRSHTIIYSRNIIGGNFQTGHKVMIRENTEIGNNVSIGTGTVIEHHVKIGNNVRIHSQTFVPEYTILEDDCWIGPMVCITNALHPLCPKVKECLKGATIKKGAKIGANSTILPDVIIGEYALVGAGSVVVKDVPPYKVVIGNPAKIIKDVRELKCPYGLIIKPYDFKEGTNENSIS